MNKKHLKILKRNEKLSNQLVKLYEMERKKRAKMIVSIHDMVIEMGGLVVEEDDDYPLMTYDGGRHAEYNSTINACVEGVNATFNQDGSKSFSVNLDEEPNYDEQRMNFDDVCTIFDFVRERYESWLQDMEDMADDVLHEFK